MPTKSGKRLNLNEQFNVRVIQRNLVYVIGLAPEISHEKELIKDEYFGQYGAITKIVVNKDKPFHPKSPHGPTYSAYITYSSDKEASLAIQAVDEVNQFQRTIKASYGTTKYCAFFLKDQHCPNPDCQYLHSIAKENDCYPKDEMISHKILFKEQQKSVMDHLKKYRREIFSLNNKADNPVLPPLSEALGKLREFLNENYGEKVEEIQFDAKKTVHPPKQKETTVLKGYACCSKEISQPSEWKVDEEDEVPQRKILTAPLSGLNGETSKNISDKNSNDGTSANETTKAKKKKSKTSIKKDTDQKKQPDEQLKNFSKQDKLILDKQKESYSTFTEPGKGAFVQNCRPFRRNIGRKRLQEDFDIVEECAHISRQIKAFIEKSYEVEKNKTPEKNSDVSTSCNTKTADTADERKAEDSFGDAIININSKKNSAQSDINTACEQSININTNIKGSVSNDKLPNTKNIQSNIKIMEYTKKQSENNSYEIKNNVNNSTDSNSFEKKEYRLFNKAFSHIRRAKPTTYTINDDYVVS